ncbi:hypothetical protein BOX15_Mlig028909g1, partial [Macrostomum lignano]
LTQCFIFITRSRTPLAMTGSKADRLQDVPKPPAFLDPLYTLETCYYYCVPTFHSTGHPITCWLLKRILCRDSEAIRRKLELNPATLQSGYFQLLDDPTVYTDCSDSEPMFHRKCVLYLSTLGLAMYFKSFEVVDLLLSFRSSNNSPVASPNEPQYATHLQDSVDGDFHAFPLYMLLLRRSVFQAATPMQQAGWVPGKAFAMPLRRRFERRLIYYRDWLDAALALHSSRPSFPLAALVNSVTSCPGYCYSRFPVESVAKPKASDDAAAKNSKSKSKSDKSGKKSTKKSGKSGKAGKGQVDPAVYARQPGAMEFGDQPLSVPVIGVKSLASLCDLADRLRQTKQRAADIRELLREARADGLNTEVLMAQALDDIKPDPKPEDSNENNCSTKTQPPSNSNNHAAAEKKKKSNMQSPDEAEHCSEPLRIVLLGLERERCRQQCMEAVSVYVHRRSYFGFGQQLDPEHGRCRDVRNMVVCLLNSIGCEQAAIDSIVQSIRAGHPRWRALEAVKQQRTSAIARISALMTAILISSKEIVDFLAKDSYPPYAPNSVDFELHPRVATAMTSIRYGIVRDLNASRDAWKYLTPEMLTEVVQNSAVLLHFKVGKRPSKAMMDEYKKKLDMQIKKKK